MQYRTEIKIHTQTDIFDATDGGDKDVSKDVRSWSTTKRYGTPAGTWQIQLSTRPDSNGKTWFEKLSPQDFVSIRLAIGSKEIQEDGSIKGQFVTVMNGLINRVFRDTNVNPGTGEVQESIRVTGLDLAKVLTKFSVWYNPISGGLEGILKGLALLSTDEFVGKPIDKALEALLDLVLNKPNSEFVTKVKSDPKIGGGKGALSVFVDLDNLGKKKIYDMLKLHATVGAVTSNVQNLTTFEGTVWNGFRRWANEPWNELFVDNGHPDNESDRAGDGNAQSLETDDDTTFIYLRPAPFTSERFARLVTHDILYEDIQAPFSISKGDDDCYTAYFSYPVFILSLSEISAKALPGGFRIIQKDTEVTGPTGKKELAKSPANRFSFRLLDKKSIYLAAGNVDATTEELEEELQRINDSDILKRLTDELVEFFDPNPTFLTGSVTLKPHRTKTLVKIGQRIRVKENPKGRPNELYYVVGVQNNWQFSNRFTQTLELHRGIQEV